MRYLIRRTRGFTLLEVLLTLILLGVASTIIIPMMNWGIVTTRAAQHQAAMGLRFDSVATQLRNDIWKAPAFTVTTPTSLVIHQADDSQINWTIGPGDQLTRNSQRWTDLGIAAGAMFQSDAHAVRLVIPARPDGTHKSVTFLGETALLTRGSP